MTCLKAIATLMLACAGFALAGGARADIDEMQLGASISKDSKTVSFRSIPITPRISSFVCSPT